jgi:transposase-like protein
LSGILNQLLHDRIVAPDTVKVMELLNNERFKLIADYKLRGGVLGHKGSNLQQSEAPDEINILTPNECSCGCNDIKVIDEYEARQQINLKIEQIITEFRLMYGYCSKCGKKVKAKSTIASNVSYHYKIRCYAVYMLDAHYMTYERLSIYFKDVFGLPISEGSINNWRKEFAEKLGDSYIEKLKELLLQSSYLHADETGLNVAGNNLWAHVVCNSDGTLIHISTKRGKDGITASDVLNNYRGTLIADGWAAYKNLPYIEGIQACFAHLFRYFKDISDNYNQAWSTKMASLLKFGLDSTKRLSLAGVKKYSEASKSSIINKYDKIVKAGQLEVRRCNYGKGHPANCLIKRLAKEKDSILRFLNDIRLPLTNNEAERSLRPIKVQQKISGTALSINNAQENLDIRSFTATCKKQKTNVLNSMYRIFLDSSDFELVNST